MLWVPTSQAVVAMLAPKDIRGAYMGAFGSAPAIGFALSPLIGLQVRNSFGDDVTWTMYRRSSASSPRCSADSRSPACTGAYGASPLLYWRREAGRARGAAPRGRAARADGSRAPPARGRRRGPPLEPAARAGRSRCGSGTSGRRRTATSPSLGGPLPYMLRLREIESMTADHLEALATERERAPCRGAADDRFAAAWRDAWRSPGASTR